MADHSPFPTPLADDFGLVLIYRDNWCPYCNAQLRAFQRGIDNLTELRAKVVAFSVDEEATTSELVAKLGLTFPVGHSADAQAVGAAKGPSPTHTEGSWNPPASS